MDEALAWVEAHPVMAGVIGIGGLFIVLWWFGFFSSGTGTANAGAAAYYNAEAQQAAAGAAIQQTSIQATAAQGIAAIQANGAVGIAQAQAGAAVSINQQNAGRDTALGYDQVLIARSNNTAATQQNYNNNYFANQTAATHDAALTSQNASTNYYNYETALANYGAQQTIAGYQATTAQVQARQQAAAQEAGYASATTIAGLQATTAQVQARQQAAAQEAGYNYAYQTAHDQAYYGYQTASTQAGYAAQTAEAGYGSAVQLADINAYAKDYGIITGQAAAAGNVAYNLPLTYDAWRQTFAAQQTAAGQFSPALIWSPGSGFVSSGGKVVLP